MKKFSIFATAAVVAALLVPGAALAGDGNSRVAVGYTHFEAGGGDLGLVTGQVQWGFGRFLGVEGVVHHGIVDEEITRDMQRATVEAQFGYGAFVVTKFPIGLKGTEIFARAGYQDLELEASSGPTVIGTNVKDFSFGGGASWMFTPHHGMRAEYTNIAGAGSGFDTYSLSYVLRF